VWLPGASKTLGDAEMPVLPRHAQLKLSMASICTDTQGFSFHTGLKQTPNGHEAIACLNSKLANDCAYALSKNFSSACRHGWKQHLCQWPIVVVI